MCLLRCVALEVGGWNDRERAERERACETLSPQYLTWYSHSKSHPKRETRHSIRNPTKRTQDKVYSSLLSIHISKVLPIASYHISYTMAPMIAGTLQTDPRSGGLKRSSGVNVLPIVAESE